MSKNYLLVKKCRKVNFVIFHRTGGVLPQLLSDAKQRIDDIVWIPSVFMGGFCIQKCIVGVNSIVKILAEIS